MKKFWSLGLLALSLCAVSTSEAPAWMNWKFGIGANLAYQSGGNNTLWGLFRNGQPPGPGCDPCLGGACGPMGGPFAPGALPPGPPLPPPGAVNAAPYRCPQPWFPYPYPFPHYGPNEFQYFGKNAAPAHNVPGVPASNTVHSGYFNALAPAAYRPYSSYYFGR